MRRITRRAVPVGMVADITANYGSFVAEIQRLGWIDDDNEITERGYKSLAELAAGDDNIETEGG